MDDRRISTPPARPPVQLPDDVVEQVLIRLPPDDPALLLRAAAVCKDWCRIVSGAGFRRCLREFHRTALMLGIICNFRDEEGDPTIGKQCARFVPTSLFRPPVTGQRDWCAIDARHGHVLLNKRRWGYLYSNAFAVWDPIKGEMTELPPIPGDPGPDVFWRAAVLCASAGGGACNHLGCHHGPFQVVTIATATGLTPKQVRAYVYSSEARAWSVPPLQLPLANSVLYLAVPSALVENALFFAFDAGTKLLKFDLAKQEMSLICTPLQLGHRQFVLTTTEGGQLGFAMVAKCKRLYLWSRAACGEGDSGWTQSRVIELEKLLPAAALWNPYVVASVDGMGVFFMLTDDGLYTVDVKTSKVKKICEYNRRPGIFSLHELQPSIESFLYD